MAKKISRQGASLALQSKKVMDKIKYRDLPETDAIKAEIQSTIAVAINIDQYLKSPMDSMKK